MNNRIGLIQELVRTHNIRSQEELIGLLAQRGVQATQATLSRDLRKLHISKQHDAAGQYHYVLPEPSRSAQAILLSESRAGESIVSLCFSGQMGVIKTLPGCANMVGALVDEHEHPDLMGTLAGENTLLLALREGTSHAGLLSFLEGFIPGIRNRLTE
jgi:transcriptional regulator of arginine metabolism